MFVLSSYDERGREVTLDPDYRVNLFPIKSEILAEPALVTPFTIYKQVIHHKKPLESTKRVSRRMPTLGDGV